MNIIIRKATIEDKNIFYQMGIKFTEFNSRTSNQENKFFMKDWEKYFMEETELQLKNEKSLVLFAMDGEVCCGYIHAYYCDSCDACYINELFVEPEYRKLNLGKQLMTEAEEWCKKYDVPIKLEVYEWNTSAINFYKKCGYNIDSLVMEKSL